MGGWAVRRAGPRWLPHPLPSFGAAFRICASSAGTVQMRQYVRMGQLKWGIRMTAAAVTAALLAGCASTPARAGSQSVLVGAATKSEAASSFHFSGSESASQSGQPADRATVTGAVDLATHRFEITTVDPSVDTPPATVVPNESLPPAPPMQTGPETVITIGKDVWVTGSGVLLAKQGEWMHLTPPYKVPDPFFSDPSKFLDMIRSQPRSVQYLGTATIDGTATDHYRVLESSKPEGSFLTLVSGNIDVWVDPEGLVRQLSWEANERPNTGQQLTFTTDITIDFTGYGQPVNIQPPPASDVVQESASGS